jgi:hypothetical protein
VERLHAQLLRHSRDAVAAEIKTLRPNTEEAAKP